MKLRMTALILLPLLLTACGPKVYTQSEKEVLRTRSAITIEDFKKIDPTLASALAGAHAYVIFPQITTIAVGIGGAGGTGEVYAQGKFVGYATVAQGSVGAQIGAQRYAELIVFRTELPFLNFKSEQFEFDARVSAVAAANGAAASADYSKGVVIFTMPESGLMAQAAVGGQKFRFEPVD